MLRVFFSPFFIVSQVLEDARRISEKLAADKSARPYLVHVFQAESNAKAVNSALKEMEKLLPSTAIMAITVDKAANKLLCLTQVPKVRVSVILELF